MFGLPTSTFYPNLSNSFMYLPTADIGTAQFLTSTPDAKRKLMEKCSNNNKRFCSNAAARPVRKTSFDIESLLELKSKSQPSPINQSYNEDTEDGSSDDGQTSFQSPPLSSYVMFNQLKSLDMTVHSNMPKNDHTPSSSSESEHSPYRLTTTKHLSNNRHSISGKTKPKRIRTIFTPEQLERLEAEFDKQQYMVGNERFYLATTLDLTEAQVKVWFQNRRIKWRRQAMDDHQQRLSTLAGTLSTSSSSAPADLNDDHPPSDSEE